MANPKQTVHMDTVSALRSVTIDVLIVHHRRFEARLRIKAAVALVRLAGWIANMNVFIHNDDSSLLVTDLDKHEAE